MIPEQLAELNIPSDPRLSPDGTKAAFVVSTPNLEADRYQRSIWIENERFTRGPGDTAPRWSPDGSHIAFLRSVDGKPAQLAVIPVGGGEAEVLTSFDKGVEALEWSPDGDQIVVVAVTYAEEWADLDDDERARRPRRLTDVPYRFDNKGWIHDRKRHLWLVDPSGESEPRCLTPGEFDEEMPAWSPDGDRIAFLSDRDPRQGLSAGNDAWELDLASGEVTQVTQRGNWTCVSYRRDGTLHLLGNKDSKYPVDSYLHRREDDGTLMRLLTAPIYLTHLALPPLLIVMARVHLAKFRVSVEHVREANRILAEALRRREMELAVSHARQRDLERGEAAQEERERIYSELHDGIGSKLVRTIFSVRDGRLDRDQVERGLLEVLQGVREVISETDTTEHRPIQDILFDYGVDLDALLSAPDFQVSYDIENDRECVLLGGLSKEVMRIVEESVANTLKYARASRLNLSLRLDGDLLVVVVEDDGQSAAGPAPAVRPAFGTSTGQGLVNMRERARRVGGEYRFERGPDGARSTLILPLVAAVAAPRHEVVAPR